MGKKERAKRRLTPNKRTDSNLWNPRLRQHGPKITREMEALWLPPEPPDFWYAAALPGSVDEPCPERMEDEWITK